MSKIGTQIIKSIPLFQVIIDELNALDESSDMDKYRPRMEVTDDWFVVGEAKEYHKLLFVLFSKAMEQYEQAKLIRLYSASDKQLEADLKCFGLSQKVISLGKILTVIVDYDFPQPFLAVEHDRYWILEGWKVGYKKKVWVKRVSKKQSKK